MNENIDVAKDSSTAIKALNTVDTALYAIADTLQQNGMYDVRKDILSFILNINDIYEYLANELDFKVNPPSESEQPDEAKSKKK